MKRLFYFLIASLVSLSSFSQTVNDGLMMPAKSLCTGIIYNHDQWRDYWEGSLKRKNLNLGTVTTQSMMWYGVYGLNSKVNLIGMVPYVWTNASMGTLSGMKGIQDLTLAAKYNFFRQESAAGKLKAFITEYFYFNPRPSQLDPSIKTSTGIPNFPSYISGHSTFSGSAATVLSYLFPTDTQFFNDQASEASLSRLYGAIHYRNGWSRLTRTGV